MNALQFLSGPGRSPLPPPSGGLPLDSRRKWGEGARTPPRWGDHTLPQHGAYPTLVGHIGYSCDVPAVLPGSMPRYASVMPTHIPPKWGPYTRSACTTDANFHAQLFNRLSTGFQQAVKRLRMAQAGLRPTAAGSSRAGAGSSVLRQSTENVIGRKSGQSSGRNGPKRRPIGRHRHCISLGLDVALQF